MREQVFISYAHEDEFWREKFEGALNTGFYKKHVHVWSDRSIEPGKDWYATIEGAIEKARVALLLVSRAFLESDFIAREELESILVRHEAGGLSLFWVPLEQLSPQDLRLVPLLGRVQSPWPLDRPLCGLNDEELNAAIHEIRSKLLAQLGVLADTSVDERDALKEAVKKAVRGYAEIVQELGAGDFSIVYKATKKDRATRKDIEVAVKALVPSRRKGLAKDFITRANIVRDVTNSAAIRIIEVIPDAEAPCVILEFASGRTLETRLSQDGPLAGKEAASILMQLVEAAEDIHRMEGQPILGPTRPKDVFIENDQARINLLRFCHEALPSCHATPTFSLNAGELTYLSPERYEGLKLTPSSDQYYLGLLGLELLLGTPPVTVKTFADLEKKRAFFDAPRTFFGAIPSQNPALSFVLARMLEKRPENRWASMQELAHAFDQLAYGAIPDAVRERALTEYQTKLYGKPAFYRSFYQRLFEMHPKIRDLFPSSMEEQYRKLDQAILVLLSVNFHSRVQLTPLDATITKHRAYALGHEHLDAFRDAFLNALSEVDGTDAYSQDAWRAILDSALAYMRPRVIAQGQADPSFRGIATEGRPST